MMSLDSNLNTQKTNTKGKNFLEHHPLKEVGLRLHLMKAKTKSLQELTKQNCNQNKNVFERRNLNEA